MAGSRGKSNSPKRSAKGINGADTVDPFLRRNADWKGYVNVEFTEKDKEQFDGFADDPHLVSEISAEVLLKGYKITSVQVDDDQTVRSTAFAAFAGMPDEGLAVSVWGDSLLNSIAAVVFVVAIHARFDLSKFVEPEVKKSRRTFG